MAWHSGSTGRGFSHNISGMILLRLMRMAGLVLVASALPAFSQIISSMDELRWNVPKEKAQAELVEGKVGKAVQFSFERESRSVFFTSNLKGNPDWDKAAGFSFWVKGQGSNVWGGLQFIYNEDYGLRYDYMFPVRGTNWTQVVVAWSDLIPVLPGTNAHLLNPKGGNLPSKLRGPWFGKWWYWGEYPAHAYAVDEIRLEPVIAKEQGACQTDELPLQRFLKKLQAGKPVTIVTMGDSLTDYRHWANREVAWPKLLREQLRQRYGSEVTIANPAIGGTQLRQNTMLIPRWLEQAPEPDLVTICFGGNDWESGMRGSLFEEAYGDTIERVRCATKGKADILVMTTVPSVAQWTTRAELGEAGRKAAIAQKAGLADTEKAFWMAGEKDKERLFVRDKVHLSPDGHKLTAETVLKCIEAAASR
jgi:lysophospholipase L1-like esterase